MWGTAVAADPRDSTRAWDEADLANPHAQPDKARRVEAMFAAIAESYDLNNRLHSFGRDQAWRRAAVRAAGLRGGEVVADVACGTGDLAMAFADALQRLPPSRDNGRELARQSPDQAEGDTSPTPATAGGPPTKTAPPRGGRVVGLDFTRSMLDLAERKRGGRPIEYRHADAMDLPLDAASVDVVSIAFGIRNVADPGRALAEFHRVLKPGGRLVVLEFSEPRNPLLRWGNALYCRRVMPWTATLIARDRSGAYRYLPKSVATFLDRDALAEAMRQAGFADVTTRPVTFGVAAIHRGLKP